MAPAGTSVAGAQAARGRSWHLDEADVRVKGEWRYLYRAVDGAGHTVDFLLAAWRDRKAARHFLQRAFRSFGLPERIDSDQSRASGAAVESCNAEQETSIEARRAKYLDNLIEQDHRAIKCLKSLRPKIIKPHDECTLVEKEEKEEHHR